MRYCGEYYDAETGLIYLRARYYDPSIGRFISEDPIKDGINWYVYCSNNPIKFVDPSGLYNREKAVNFALKYGEVSWHESYPLRFSPDCTNFASQVLQAGGIKNNDNWYLRTALIIMGKVIGPLSNYSTTWTVANEQYKWISNPDNGYINGSVLMVNKADSIPQIIEDNNVQKGDLLYWDFNNDGKIDHTSVIVSTEGGDITYAQHSGDKTDGKLKPYLESDPKARVFIVRIKDTAV